MVPSIGQEHGTVQSVGSPASDVIQSLLASNGRQAGPHCHLVDMTIFQDRRWQSVAVHMGMSVGVGIPVPLVLVAT